MGAEISGAVSLEMMNCGECGIQFAVPSAWIAIRRRGTENEHRGFTCPNGHTRVFQETEVERLRRELAAKEEQLAREREAKERAEKEALGQRLAAGRARAETKRIRTRVAAGMCPCCKRSFVQLRRHMENKHPDYRELEVVK
jgi:hypothetical protein